MDIINLYTAPEIRIGVSSSVEDGLVADYASERSHELVGIEFWAAGKHLAPFCVTNEADVAKAEMEASKFPSKASYDRELDVLTFASKYEVAAKISAGGGIVAYFGYCDASCEPCEDCYDLVGFELHNASECLAPWFELNRGPFSAADRQSD